jgi:hypothetical protein
LSEEEADYAAGEPAEAPAPAKQPVRRRDLAATSHIRAAVRGNGALLGFQRQLASMDLFKNLATADAFKNVVGEFGISQRVKVLDMPGVDRLVRDQIKLADLVTPSVLRSAELTSTARISELVAHATAVSSWRSTLLTEQLMRDLVGRPRIAGLFDKPVLDDLLGVGHSAVILSRWAADLAPGRDILRGLTAVPLKSYQRYIDALPPEPHATQMRLSLVSGRGVNGLMGTELLTGDVDAEDEDAAAALVDIEVIEPWAAGPASARSELLVVLADLDATVPELLNGAWDDVVRQGPAALVKIANCAVEALDRSLRAVAPDDDVRQWIATDKKPADFIDDNGRPTRAARLHFALRCRASDRMLVESQASALAVIHRELLGRLQASKHASAGNVAAVRAHLLSAEALLHQLFASGA